MAISQAMLGYGSKVEVTQAEDASPAVFFELQEVFNITPPTSEVDQVDVSHMSSPGRAREFVDGLITPGECSFSMNYVPGSPSDQFLRAILATPLGQPRKRTVRLTYPNGIRDAFEANLRTYEPDIPTEDKMTATIGWQVTGQVYRVKRMANPLKGDTPFEANGKTYTLRFSIDALCQLEKETGLGIINLTQHLSDAEKLSLTMMRASIWAGLREHHPEVTLKQAGELIIAAGGLAKMLEPISKAFANAFPEEAADKDDAVANPPQPDQTNGGTGPVSIKAGAA